jgi:hypothetical protein
MGLKDRVGDVRRAASAGLDKSREAASAGLDKGREKAAALDKEAIQAAGRGAVATARQADDWVLEQLKAVRPPTLPLAEPWKLSIGGIVAAHPKAPRLTGRLLGPLDRFGAIEIGPDEIGFDGDTVAWDKVTEVRTRSGAELAVGALWDFAIDDLRSRLPPVPGRKWAVTKVLQVLLAMTVDLDKQAEGEDGPQHVACEIIHRGRIQRNKKTTTGVFSALALCALPQVGEALASAAGERGIPVVPAKPYEHVSANERVARMRRQRAALAAKADELESADDEDA